ncbi:hypothetical protein AWENTII_008262 [Aspergillus wentii]|nr:hypothetical protein MW887_008195 [Aspergillus wentii]
MLAGPPKENMIGPAEGESAPEYFFFYDALMDPSTLARVIQRPGQPNIRRARVQGWTCKLWNGYPALIEGNIPNPNIVYGVAYEVQTERERDLLVQFETEAYKLQPAGIWFEDDNTLTIGWMFLCNREEEGLQDGTFDLQAWLTRQNS